MQLAIGSAIVLDSPGFDGTFRTTMQAKLSLLGYILLGLLRKQPQSGYDLRRTFATTPMMSYSDSPGAIYPALKRLEKQGLLKNLADKNSGVRERRVYRLTPAGVAALKSWLALPVTHDDIVRNVGIILLRFSFMDAAVGSAGSLRFLQHVEPQLKVYTASIKGYLSTAGSDMPLSGRLALDFGVRSYEVLLQWTRDAIHEYTNLQPS